MERDLKERILDISYKEKLSHLGSNLTAVDLIESVYKIKKDKDKFVLSSGHAGLALYVVLEKYGFSRFNAPINAEKLYQKHGVHPNRDPLKGIHVSSGSLGQGLPISLGMALARNSDVYCLISDGETSEGSIWEALRVGAEQNVRNLKVICNFNGYAAYKETDAEELVNRFEAFGWQVNCVDGHNQEEIINSLRCDVQPTITFGYTNVNDYPFLQGLDSHYHTMNDTEYAMWKEETISK